MLGISQPEKRGLNENDFANKNGAWNMISPTENEVATLQHDWTKKMEMSNDKTNM